MKVYKLFIGLVYFLLILGTILLNYLSHNFFKRRWNPWIGYGLPALLMVIFLSIVSEPHPLSLLFADFNNAYYPAGRLILEDQSNLYSSNISGGLGFVNIPIIALLFTPLAYLSQLQANILFTIFGVATLLAAIYIFHKLSNINKTGLTALIILIVINGPLYYSIRLANITHILFLLLILGIFCLQTRRDFILGVLLAICATIKIPLLLIAVYFTLRKKWLVVAGFATASLLIFGASLLLFGMDLHWTWYQTIIQPYSGKSVAAYNVQSVDGFIARLLTSDNLYSWLPLDLGWKFKLIRYASVSVILGASILVCWHAKSPKTLTDENLEFSIALCLALIISPISWTHYYFLLVLPFSLYFGEKLAIPKGGMWYFGIILSVLFTSLPVVYYLPENPFLRLLYTKFFVSHYFFGGLLFLGILLAARWNRSKLNEVSQQRLVRQ